MCCYEEGRAKIIISRDVVFVENVMYMDDKIGENTKQTTEREKSGQEDNHGQTEPLAFERDNTKKDGQLSEMVFHGLQKANQSRELMRENNKMSLETSHGQMGIWSAFDHDIRKKKKRKRMLYAFVY